MAAGQSSFGGCSPLPAGEGLFEGKRVEDWKVQEFQRSVALDRARLQAEHANKVKACLRRWKVRMDREAVQDRAYAEIAAAIAVLAGA